MSVDIESAGALVTAGLVASEIDGSKTTAASAHSNSCRNCGATMAGAYCSACGQSSHLHRSLLHLAEEVAHGVLHFDAKGWRTLPLLIARPGVLTRRYIDGQRVRYVSPLALFLFTVFLMFFVVSLSNGATHVGTTDTRADLETAVKEARKSNDDAQANLARLQAAGKDTEEAADDLNDAKIELAATQAALSALETASAAKSAATPAASTDPAGDESAGIEPMAKPRAEWSSKLRKSGLQARHPTVAAALKHAIENPELMLYKLKNTAYKYSFLLVPISLPFVWLMFASRRDVTAYDHAVFVLYSLSFMSLLMVAASLVSLVPFIAGFAWLAIFVPPSHMALQLKDTYRLGFFGTAWRTCALLVVAGIVFMVYTALIVVLTMG